MPKFDGQAISALDEDLLSSGWGLIRDQVLASKMSAIACRAGDKAGIPQSHELANWLWKGPAWSRFRYACYLQFMNSQKDMQPDLLELLLFNLELEL